jgi:hypothetical protein
LGDDSDVIFAERSGADDCNAGRGHAPIEANMTGPK